MTLECFPPQTTVNVSCKSRPLTPPTTKGSLCYCLYSVVECLKETFCNCQVLRPKGNITQMPACSVSISSSHHLVRKM